MGSMNLNTCKASVSGNFSCSTKLICFW